MDVHRLDHSNMLQPRGKEMCYHTLRPSFEVIFSRLNPEVVEGLRLPNDALIGFNLLFLRRIGELICCPTLFLIITFYYLLAKTVGYANMRSCLHFISKEIIVVLKSSVVGV